MKKRYERGRAGAGLMALVLLLAAGSAAASHPAGQDKTQTGSLRVTILPPSAAAAGARWRIAREATWRTSGSWLHDLKVGPVTIEFKPVTGWTKPQNQSATIPADQSVERTGTYVVLPASQTGSLKVTLSPQLAANQGGRWKPVNSSAWQTSGSTMTNLNTGYTAIEFRVIQGWNTPPNKSVTITAGQTATASATYAQQPGSIKVDLKPPAAVSAGAQWRVVGTADWGNSGALMSGVTPGPQVIEFKDIAGWKKPSNKSITVPANRVTIVTGTYLPPSQK